MIDANDIAESPLIEGKTVIDVNEIAESPLIKDHILLATLIVVAVLWFLKIFTDEYNKELSLSEKISKALYGATGSVLTTWLVFELLFAYTDLPFRLDLTIAAIFGYIGAETSIKIGIRLFGKKFNVDLKDLEKENDKKEKNKQQGETNNGEF